MKDDVDLGKATNQIEIFDTAAAFLSGMMIIPAVYVFLGTEGMTFGPSLTFVSLPKVFQSMGLVGRLVGAAFFLMLGFAALTSCVSVMETLVANCMELFHKSRKQMCAVIGLYSLVTAVLICLGYNALLTSILIGWIVGPKWICDEVQKNGEAFPRAGLYSVLVRYVVPVVMLVLFLVSTGLWKLNF